MEEVEIRLKDLAGDQYKNAKEFADAIQLSYRTIYPLWDNTAKRLDKKTIKRICDFLNVPAGWLIVYDPRKRKEAL